MTDYHKFDTTYVWYDADENEYEVEAQITYAFRKGYNGDYYQPPEDASVEITDIKITKGDISIAELDKFAEGDELERECFSDYQNYQDAMEESRADAAREARWDRD